jgi:hypothetical protein
MPSSKYSLSISEGVYEETSPTYSALVSSPKPSPPSVPLPEVGMNTNYIPMKIEKKMKHVSK